MTVTRKGTYQTTLQAELDWYQQEISKIKMNSSGRQCLNHIYDYVKDQLMHYGRNPLYRNKRKNADLQADLLRGLKESIDFIKAPKVHAILYKNLIRTYESHSSGVLSRMAGLMYCLFGAVCMGLGIMLAIAPPTTLPGIGLTLSGFGMFSQGPGIYRYGKENSKKYSILKTLTANMKDIVNAVELAEEMKTEKMTVSFTAI